MLKMALGTAGEAQSRRHLCFSGVVPLIDGVGKK